MVLVTVNFLEIKEAMWDIQMWETRAPGSDDYMLEFFLPLTCVTVCTNLSECPKLGDLDKDFEVRQAQQTRNLDNKESEVWQAQEMNAWLLIVPCQWFFCHSQISVWLEVRSWSLIVLWSCTSWPGPHTFVWEGIVLSAPSQSRCIVVPWLHSLLLVPVPLRNGVFGSGWPSRLCTSHGVSFK